MDTETPLGNNVLEGGIESSTSSPFAHTHFQLTLVQPSSIHSLLLPLSLIHSYQQNCTFPIFFITSLFTIH